MLFRLGRSFRSINSHAFRQIAPPFRIAEFSAQFGTHGGAGFSPTDANSDTPSYLHKLFNLDGSVAFVTGCSRGIGRETCLTLARAGADVVVTDFKDSCLRSCEELADQIREMGRRATSAVCDVRYPVSVTEAMRKCKEELGQLDILVANAGILGDIQLPENMEESDWRNIFATNVDGVFHCARAAYPLMKERKGGKVIIMSSVASMTGYSPQAAFSSSKGAVIPLARSLAVAWARDNIQVNCVLPGAVNTDFINPVLDAEEMKRTLQQERIPAKRFAEPEEITGAILFFASRASDYCTGSQLVVDGGLSTNVFTG